MENTLNNVKDDLIAEINKRIDDKIIEKTNADLLKKLILQAETVNEAIMIAELGTTYKRTGFHFDKRLEKMTDTIKYFKKNEKLSFVQEKTSLTHKLIIGDNYDALLNLLIEYRGKIDMIYIDPPYGKDSMGEFAQTNYDNSITRDNLLSMLYPRLVLARQLLSDIGVIFCSIDDKNQAYVKGLFDEVFGESGFIGMFKWNKVAKAPSLSGSIRNKYEYILAYYKNERIKLFGKSSYNNQGPLWHLQNKRSLLTFPAQSIKVRQSFNIGYYGGTYEVELLDNLIEENGLNKNEVRVKAHSAWGQAKVIQYVNDGFIFEIKKNPKTFYTALSSEGNFIAPSDLISKHECGVDNNTDASKALKTIGINFSNPKPVSLIRYLVDMVTHFNTSATILDYFAGSGTTGQAVLEINKQDGGQRRFILATANEITNTTPNGIVNDVTSKRLRRVMTGECYDGTKDFEWNKKNEPLGDNLDVYDIATVAPYSNEPFEKIDEILYGKKKLGVKDKIKWVCENFEGTQKFLEDK